jgi:hypothetical protein
LRFDENIKRAFYDHYEFEQLLLLQLLEDAAFAVAAGIKSYMKSARIFCFGRFLFFFRLRFLECESNLPCSRFDQPKMMSFFQWLSLVLVYWLHDPLYDAIMIPCLDSA